MSEGTIELSYEEISDVVAVLKAFVKTCPKGMMDDRCRNVKAFIRKLNAMLEKCDDEDCKITDRRDIN